MNKLAILVSVIVIVAIIIGVVFFNNENNNLDISDPPTKIEKVSIRGIVTQIITDSSEKSTILVEGDFDEDTTYDKASIIINKDSTITKIPNSKTLKISDINIGDTIEVIFDGPVAESYPVQAQAKWVTIIK